MGEAVTARGGADRLGDSLLHEVDRQLRAADEELVRHWPGDSGTRQPVHTLYLPADQVATADAGQLFERLGAAALSAMEAAAGGSAGMAQVTGLPAELVDEVWPRVLRKLVAQPVEDLRLDLEDGYGLRPDDEEDRDADRAGALLGGFPRTGAPLVAGVRVKSLESPSRARGLRSLERVLAAMLEKRRALPPQFLVTLPKVTSVDQVRAMTTVCERLESGYDLVPGALRFEIQVETPQAVLGADGRVTVAPLLHAAGGRCSGLHYGTYDYSASLGVAAAAQAMDHPVADLATSLMQLAAAQTGVRVAHGSTNVLPVGSADEVRSAWALHARLVRRHLERGIYQGWDLHPAQLVTRYLATYAFYREGFAAATARLNAYAARADSGTLDEPATAFALASFLLRGIDCGALDEDEVLAATGVDAGALAGFARRTGGLGRLERLPVPDLRAALAAVCSSLRWVDLVARARPYGSVEGLLSAADRALADLGEDDLDSALAGHPRIGERSESSSSRREQSGVAENDRAALVEANREYEERFGHVYLVCASGRSGSELLQILRTRLTNSPEVERSVARAELGKINALRLQRLVEEG